MSSSRSSSPFPSKVEPMVEDTELFRKVKRWRNNKLPHNERERSTGVNEILPIAYLLTRLLQSFRSNPQMKKEQVGLFLLPLRALVDGMSACFAFSSTPASLPQSEPENGDDDNDAVQATIASVSNRCFLILNAMGSLDEWRSLLALVLDGVPTDQQCSIFRTLSLRILRQDLCQAIVSAVEGWYDFCYMWDVTVASSSWSPVFPRDLFWKLSLLARIDPPSKTCKRGDRLVVSAAAIGLAVAWMSMGQAEEGTRPDRANEADAIDALLHFGDAAVAEAENPGTSKKQSDCKTCCTDPSAIATKSEDSPSKRLNDSMALLCRSVLTILQHIDEGGVLEGNNSGASDGDLSMALLDKAEEICLAFSETSQQQRHMCPLAGSNKRLPPKGCSSLSWLVSGFEILAQDFDFRSELFGESASSRLDSQIHGAQKLSVEAIGSTSSLRVSSASLILIDEARLATLNETMLRRFCEISRNSEPVVLSFDAATRKRSYPHEASVLVAPSTKAQNVTDEERANVESAASLLLLSKKIAVLPRVKSPARTTPRKSTTMSDANANDDVSAIVREQNELDKWCNDLMLAKAWEPSVRLLLRVASDEWMSFIEAAVGRISQVATVGFGIADESPQSRYELVQAATPGVTPTLAVEFPANEPVDVFCKVMVAWYFHVLMAIATQGTQKSETTSTPQVVLTHAFHTAVVAYCLVCVARGFIVPEEEDDDEGETKEKVTTKPKRPSLEVPELFQTMDMATVLHLVDCTPDAYIKVSEMAGLALGSQGGSSPAPKNLRADCSIPRILHRFLAQCEISVMDSLLWSTGSKADEGSIIDCIQILRSCQRQDKKLAVWPPLILEPTMQEEVEDYLVDRKIPTSDIEQVTSVPNPINPGVLRHHYGKFVTYVFRKVLRTAYFRISALCGQLQIPWTIATHAMVAFRFLLRHFVELLFDRHIDQLLLCSIYSVSKMLPLEPELTFARTIEAYTRVRSSELGGETQCAEVFRKVYIGPSKELGTIVDLYNKVYVPSMKHHLLTSRSLKRVKELAAAKKREAEAFAPRPQAKIVGYYPFRTQNRVVLLRSDQPVAPWFDVTRKPHVTATPPVFVPRMAGTRGVDFKTPPLSKPMQAVVAAPRAIENSTPTMDMRTQKSTSQATMPGVTAPRTTEKGTGGTENRNKKRPSSQPMEPSVTAPLRTNKDTRGSHRTNKKRRMPLRAEKRTADNTEPGVDKE